MVDDIAERISSVEAHIVIIIVNVTLKIRVGPKSHTQTKALHPGGF